MLMLPCYDKGMDRGPTPQACSGAKMDPGKTILLANEQPLVRLSAQGPQQSGAAPCPTQPMEL